MEVSMEADAVPFTSFRIIISVDTAEDEKVIQKMVSYSHASGVDTDVRYLLEQIKAHVG